MLLPVLPIFSSSLMIDQATINTPVTYDLYPLASYLEVVVTHVGVTFTGPFREITPAIFIQIFRLGRCRCQFRSSRFIQAHFQYHLPSFNQSHPYIPTNLAHHPLPFATEINNKVNICTPNIAKSNFSAKCSHKCAFPHLPVYLVIPFGSNYALSPSCFPSHIS